MSRKLLFALSFSVLFSSLLYVGLNPAEVKASNGYPIHNIDTGLNYTAIQAAIDAPETLDGHTIKVDAGIYYEHIVVVKSLTLEGENKYTTIIDAEDTPTHQEVKRVVDIAANNVKLSSFTIQHSRIGVWINGYFNNTVSDNIVTDNWDGIRILHSSGNIMSNNIVKNHPYTAVGFDWASHNTIHNNTIVDNYIGVGAGNPSCNITFSENTIIGNSYGFLIAIYDSKFFHNSIINNSVQVAFYDADYANTWDDDYPSGGNYWSDYTGVDADGDGIGDNPYVINAKNRDNYPLMNRVRPPTPPVADFTWTPSISKVGESVVFNASSSLPGWNGTHTMPITEYLWNFGDDNTTSTIDPIVVHTYTFPKVFNVTLTVWDSEDLNSSCSQMIPTRMPTLVSISTSSSSTFIGFTVDINGTLCDLYENGLENESVVLYYTFSGVTTWFPITSGITDNLGHYYAQWIPSATGYFTIKAEWVGNSTHIGASNNVTLSVLPYQNEYVFSVESNSTISALAFNTTSWELSFTASGPNGTKGYVKVTVAKSLVENITNIRVYLDGNQSEYSITSLDDSWLLTFDYMHSTHQVVVDLDINIIPEFPSAMILPMFMALILALAFAKKRLSRKPKG